MIEVEAKVRIPSPMPFREKAKQLGCFVSREKKIDDYYTLEDISHYPHKSLRIRKRNGIYEINFKKRVSYEKGVHAKKEQEFTTSDIEKFLELIKDFGFKKWLRKKKVSEVYELKKNFHIEINNVNGLGWFLEIEYLTDLQHVGLARKEILDVLKKLNIKKSQIVKEGYTKMLWDKGVSRR